jgi:peptidoglycan/LPS O-acetylase OafA/YrhL
MRRLSATMRCTGRSASSRPTWVALTVLAFWPGLDGVFTKDWWAYYGLLQSYSSSFWFRGIAVAWSLSVEVAFYVVLPLLGVALSAAGRRMTPRGRLWLQILAFAALGVGGLAFRAGFFDLLNTSPSYCFGFSVGMALAVASAWLEGREHEFPAARFIAAHSGCCWAAATVLFLATSLSPAFPRPFSDTPPTTVAYTAESAVYSSIAFLVMLPAVFGEHAGGFRGACSEAASSRGSGRSHTESFSGTPHSSARCKVDSSRPSPLDTRSWR